MITLHKRFEIVQKAKLALMQHLIDVTVEHELTPIEVIGILAERIERYQTYALRKERHPRHKNKKADEA